MLNMQNIRRGALWSAVFLVVGLLAAAFLPIPPHGRFSTPQVGNEADAYFEAADGKLTLVVFGGVGGRDGEEHRRFLGNYHREHGRWLLVTPHSTNELRATLFTLRILDQKPGEVERFYRYEIFGCR
jgi:hypothetical protein